MAVIESYRHNIASHCETGTLKNLLSFGGLDISEPMIFGLGSGPAFYYLFFAKGPSSFPLIGIRNTPGSILKNVTKLIGLEMQTGSFRTTKEARGKADALIDKGIPVAVSVDMFYMKYLPSFLHVHAPFHFILLVGRDEDSYTVSDPYYHKLGILRAEDLEAAWETHAPLAKDNYLAYLKGVPDSINWKKSIKKAVIKTCNNMVLPPVLNKVLRFAGIEGMRLYARKIREWPDRYRGVVLREGMIFNAIGFEDQGTGGAGFRLMYGAFLQEVSAIFNSEQISNLADRMIQHGRDWRRVSRKIIEVAKELPMEDDKYSDWLSENEEPFREQLGQISELFIEKAIFEEKFFKELKQTISKLK